MTSNVGARDITKGSSLGFNKRDDEALYVNIEQKVKEAVDRTFRPEFLNRIDEVIVFHPLVEEHISLIVDILIRDLKDRLKEKEISIALTDGARKFLVEKGYDKKFGARPLKRAIQRCLEDPLSEEILKDYFNDGDNIEVSEEDNRLCFKVLTTVD